MFYFRTIKFYDLSVSELKQLGRDFKIEQNKLSRLKKSDLIDIIKSVISKKRDSYYEEFNLKPDSYHDIIDFTRISVKKGRYYYSRDQLLELCYRFLYRTLKKDVSKSRLVNIILNPNSINFIIHNWFVSNQLIEANKKQFGIFSILDLPNDIIIEIVNCLIDTDYRSYRYVFYVNKKMLSICRFVQKCPTFWIDRIKIIYDDIDSNVQYDRRINEPTYGLIEIVTDKYFKFVKGMCMINKGTLKGPCDNKNYIVNFKPTFFSIWFDTYKHLIFNK